jgi:hypothetical protein
VPQALERYFDYEAFAKDLFLEGYSAYGGHVFADYPEECSAFFTHQLVTLADLEKFKEQILSEMRRLLACGGTQQAKQWLKSREVRKLLDVSPGKLHAMRLSRQLSFMRIGGVIYYDRSDIDKMFEKFKTAAVK